MDVKEFVTKFNNAKDKDTFVKKHIIRNYLPYANKINVCKNIIKFCCYIKVNELEVFKINTPLKDMLISLSFIREYTDLELSENPMNDFDLLSESMSIGLIIKNISNSEVVQLSSMLEDMINDEITNTRDLTSYLDSKLDAIKLAFDSVLNLISENVE